jgi:hypothetical protein
MLVMIEEAIVHVGMHKTGSSSIQDTFSKISMSEIQYLSLGSANHSDFLATLLSDNSEFYHNYALGAEQAQALKASYTQQLHDELEATTKPKILISADYLSQPHEKENEFLYLKQLLLRYCKRIRVIGYVCPPVSYIQSSFYQRLKEERNSTFDLHSIYPEYYKRFSKIDDVFGKENVELVAFDKDLLHNSDVVEDFANRIGIPLSPEQIVRINESISLEATALLYTFRRFEDESGDKDKVALIELLVNLKGQKLLFSESAVASVLEENRNDIHWISERLGISILDEPSTSSQSIGDEKDLFKIADANRMTVWQLLKEAEPLTRDSKGLAQLVDWLHALRARDITTLKTSERTIFTPAQSKVMLTSGKKPAKVLDTLAKVLAENGQQSASQNVRNASKRADNLLKKYGHNNDTTLQNTVHRKG